MTVAGKLPAGWCQTTVKDIGEVSTGKTPKTSVAEYYAGETAFIKPTDLEQGYFVENSKQKLSDSGVTQTRLLPKGSTLVTCIGATIGKTGFARIPCATNQQINAISPGESVEPEWPYWWFVGPVGRDALIANSSATTLPIINKSRFSALQLPLPPLNEQRRIVGKIEKLQGHSDAAKSALDAIPALLDKFRQSVLAAAFRGDLTKDWRAQNPDVEPASVLLERIRAERKTRFIETTAEKARAKAEAKAKAVGKPWTEEQDAKTLAKEAAKAEKRYKPAKPADITNVPLLPEGWCWATGEMLFSWASGKTLPTRKMQRGKISVYGGNGTSGTHNESNSEFSTLVIGRVGANCGNAHQTPGAAWITDNAIFANSISGLAKLDFVLRYFRSIDVRSMARGGGQPFVSQATLNVVQLPIPPLDEQKLIGDQISELLEAAERTLSLCFQQSKQLITLNQSILAKAFRGELVPQDPSDEPAAVLLDRIRATRAGGTKKKRKPTREARSAKGTDGSPGGRT